MMYESLLRKSHPDPATKHSFSPRIEHEHCGGHCDVGAISKVYCRHPSRANDQSSAASAFFSANASTSDRGASNTSPPFRGVVLSSSTTATDLYFLFIASATAAACDSDARL